MWQVAVYNKHQHEQFRGDGDAFSLARASGATAWQLVDGGETHQGATVRLRIADNALVLDCRGTNAGVELGCGGWFACSIPIEMQIPCVFRLGDTWIEVRAEAAAEQLALQPFNAPRDGATLRPLIAGARGPDAETIARWLAAAGRLHRIAASSLAFFDAAAQIALDTIGLDVAMVVTVSDSDLTIAGSAVSNPAQGISFEPGAVTMAVRRPEVWRRAPSLPAGQPCTTEKAGLDESIVVAPVQNDAGEVVAVVYGVRHGRGENRRRGIRALEARFIELIADAVSVGLSRRQEEIEAARQRVLLEQAFSPAVAEYLQRHPEALEGQTREVTLLFADLRDFTHLSQALPANEACSLLSAVMDALTQAIVDHGGTVIDYYGDGVSAMWNAPLETPDHADRACAAAMQMLDALPTVGEPWRHRLASPLQLGVGIHAGSVCVGNAGARQRIKYGPRGHAVNVASRVQSAAKRLNVAMLVTDAVRQRLSSRFVTLRVCTSRLPGIDEPVDLFTVFPSADAMRVQVDLERYAEALDAFERGDLIDAEEQLAELLSKGPATPAAFLAQQTAALRQGGRGRRALDELGCTPDAVIEILAK